MKKRFQFTRSNSVIFELVILAATVFLLITSISNLVFSILLPESMYPTFIGVGSLILISLYLLPKIKPETENRGVDIDSDTGELFIDEKKIEIPSEINVLRFSTDKEARFQIKFSKNEIIDSREYEDCKRLLTLLPRTFPKAEIETFIIKPINGTLVVLGIIIALVLFIISKVI